MHPLDAPVPPDSLLRRLAQTRRAFADAYARRLPGAVRW